MTYRRDDLVTVTYDDGTQVCTWHGRFDRFTQVVTHDRGPDRPARFGRVFLDQGAESEDGKSWMLLTAAAAYDFDPQGLDRESEHWSIGTFGRLWFDHNLPGLTVMRMTAEGHAFVAAHESTDNKRDRLMARVRDLAPGLATELSEVIDDLIREAEDRGEDREYRRSEGARG